MSEQHDRRCPECGEDVGGISRRDFVKGVASAAVIGTSSVLPVFATPRAASAAPAFDPKPPETLVKHLYDSLSEDQKSVICLPWDSPRRNRISANWMITKPPLGTDFYNIDQRELVANIFRGVSSEDGYERFRKQMSEDQPKGFGDYSVAIFGEPGTDQFEWVMTGRHLTIRCDGRNNDGTAFGGPIVYGHGTGDSQKGLPGNVFYYQTIKANEVFGMLDGKQREKALLEKAPIESAVQLQGEGGEFPGIAVSELSSDQKALVQQVMKVILSPYRESDVKEALECFKAGGGLEKLRLAFYKEDDVGDDSIWDIWRLEGPSFVWHFRGAPHVHTYINISTKS